MGMIKVEQPSKEQVIEWLKLARTRELNIYHDRNKIIVNLCMALLKEWDEGGE